MLHPFDLTRILAEPTWDTARDCIPESRDPGNFPIPGLRRTPGISGLTKFIYLTVILVLFKNNIVHLLII